MNIFTRNNFDKIGAFFKKNGFYIALFICIVGLGVAAVLTLTGSPQQENIAEQPSIQPAQNLLVPSLEDEIASNPSSGPSDSPELSPEASPSATPKPQQSLVLTNPVANGEIIREFSIDKLVYNKTLNQWSTHNGVDIRAEAGSDVLCALSGSISKLYSDSLSGNVVVVTHENGDISLYAGVEYDKRLEEGLRVSTGEKLGILQIPQFEEFVGSHLHFEYMRGNEYLNPQKYIK